MSDGENPHLDLWRSETFESDSDRAWEAWTVKVEKILGHDLDGDEERDGYSLDYALARFRAGWTPEEYAESVNLEKANLPKVFIVAVFLVDRACGGPEEGGWYYDCGQLVRQIRTFKNSELASAFRRRLNAKLAVTLNKGRRPIDSVLSDGMYDAQVCHDRVPDHYPAERPRYS